MPELRIREAQTAARRLACIAKQLIVEKLNMKPFPHEADIADFAEAFEKQLERDFAAVLVDYESMRYEETKELLRRVEAKR